MKINETARTSIIVPAYNEERRIQNTLISYIDYFDCEIIVVCDGHDGTAEIVKNVSKKYPKIKLFEYISKLGKGGAIIEGFKKSSGDYIGFVDADESVLPDQFEILLNELENSDCAIGSRRIYGSQILRRQTLRREISSKIFNALSNGLFDLRIKDTQCGAKVFRRKVIDNVLPKLKSTGFEFDVELLWRIKKESFSIKEVPIIWRHTDKSSFSLKYAPAMFVNLIKRRIGI